MLWDLTPMKSLQSQTSAIRWKVGTSKQNSKRMYHTFSMLLRLKDVSYLSQNHNWNWVNILATACDMFEDQSLHSRAPGKVR